MITPFSLVLGRMIATLRQAVGETQKGLTKTPRFEKESLLASGSLSWIESGRSHVSAPQLWNLERAFIDLKILTEEGDLFKLVGRAIGQLTSQGQTITHKRLQKPAGRSETLAVDWVCDQVVKTWRAERGM